MPSAALLLHEVLKVLVLATSCPCDASVTVNAWRRKCQCRLYARPARLNMNVAHCSEIVLLETKPFIKNN